MKKEYMITARLVTNLDPPNNHPQLRKVYLVDFPAVPHVGNGFLWGGVLFCRITAVGWQLNLETGVMELNVEFNR